MVREADAAALVADMLVALGLRGHDVRVTSVNGPRLVRLAGLMLDGFGVGTGERADVVAEGAAAGRLANPEVAEYTATDPISRRPAGNDPGGSPPLLSSACADALDSG